MLSLRIAIFSVGLASFFYSYVCLLKPALGISIFQRWCRYLNWKVEPIRYDFEIKNTRRLGLIGLILSLVLLYKGLFL